MTLPPLPGAPRHIVGLSGGKDSTALALWLVENEPRPYEFICNFTGNETPEMVEHWAKLEGLLGSKLIPVTHSADLVQLCEQMNMLPNFRQRWCTRILKIEPTIAFMESLPDWYEPYGPVEHIKNGRVTKAFCFQLFGNAKEISKYCNVKIHDVFSWPEIIPEPRASYLRQYISKFAKSEIIRLGDIIK